MRTVIHSIRSAKNGWGATIASIMLITCCTTAAFSSVFMHKPVSMGKDYYIVFPRNGDYYEDTTTAALINSPVKQTLTITLPGAAHKQITRQLVSSATRLHTQIPLIFHIESASETVDQGGATRIQGTAPFDVIGQYGLSPDISSTYTAIPVTGWGTEYWVLDEEEGINQGYAQYPMVYSVPNITIIASQNNTSVTIVPTTKTAKAKAPNVAFKVTLNAGDVYYISDAADPSSSDPISDEDPCEADFTGTHITSSSPIGVIVGQSWSTVPCGQGGGNMCGDASQEWLPPVCNWDSVYVVTPAAPGENNGEIMKILSGANGTSLTIWDPVSGPLQQGTLNAGDYWPYNTPITTALLISANGPILPVEMPLTSSLCESGSGPQGFNNAMVFLPGVHQWSDYTAFSTADSGVNSTANIFFRDSDYHLLTINGMPLNQISPVFNEIAEGYGWITSPVYADRYYEITGDSGATAGGSIFGDGRAKPYGGPVDAGSFAHPIGINALPGCFVDTTVPELNIAYICDAWSVTASDNDSATTGIYDVTLAQNFKPDSSYNVEFYPAPPSFAYGANSVGPFTINVTNPLLPAKASLHVRNQIGNEFDTILIFNPIKLSMSPELNIGEYPNLTSKDSFVVVTNLDTVNPVVIASVGLHFSTQWKITAPFLSFPDTLAPSASDTIYLQYTASNNPQSVMDYDTVLVTTCKEFPYATLVGRNNPAGFTATDYNFGCLTIDTLMHGGDTATTSNKQVSITNTGNDTLQIYGWSLNGVNISNAEADSIFVVLSPPVPVDSAHAYVLIPDSSLSFIIRAHPIHSYPAYDTAALVYVDDRTTALNDTSYLTVCAQTPSGVPQSPERGSILDATTISQNSPNPFSDGTDILVTLPADSHAQLTIINSMGVVVAMPLNQDELRGTFTVHVDATNLPSGFYYYRLQTKAGTYLRSMAIVK